MSKLDELIVKVECWGEDRNLIKGSNPITQMKKTLEEVGETIVALHENDEKEIIDGYGDILVTLILGMAQNNLSVVECLESAYNEIKDRKGKMVNGIFVKEE